MAKILILLESPSKISKIKSYLEETIPEHEFEVLASGGHINKIVDSGKYGLGIDLETMNPLFVPEPSKLQNIKTIAKAGKSADLIVLASDPDREGEAIAWHLANLFPKKQDIIRRATFDEITKEAVYASSQNLRPIDMHLVNAQLSRQMLDKIIGYLVSKKLQKATGLISAGRVQTPALSLLVNRDKLIKAFVITNYKRVFIKNIEKGLNLTLTKDNKGLTPNSDSTYWLDEAKTNALIADLKDEMTCTNYTSKEYETRSFIPYSTAGLLQDGYSKLKLSTLQTSIAAQKLYEEGLVTYIRTDSTRYSATFIEDAKAYINSNFKNNLFKDIVKTKKLTNAQEAHESIRPVKLENTPEKVKTLLSNSIQQRVYNLIWWNTVKSLMRGPSGINHRWTLDNNGYEFKQSWQELIDHGYQLLEKNKYDENVELDEDFNTIIGEKDNKPNFEFNSGFKVQITKEDILTDDAKTSPPNMFNQASLVKELKNLGIGRPSTYTPIITKLAEREYTEYKKGTPIKVTDKGYIAEEYLYKNFSDFFNLSYTADMELMLDNIAHEQYDHVDWLKNIFADLETKIQQIQPDENAIDCPRCHEGKLVFIKAKIGRGRGCSNFSTTGCGYREYEDKNGNWNEYIPVTAEEKAAKQEAYIQENLTDILCPKCKAFNLMNIPAQRNQGRGCSGYSKTGCTYREYTNKEGEWIEYISPEKKTYKKTSKAKK